MRTRRVVGAAALVAILGGLLALGPASAEVPIPTLSPPPPSPILPSPEPSPSPSASAVPSPKQTVTDPGPGQGTPEPAPSGEVPPGVAGPSGPATPVLQMPELVRTPSRTTARFIEILSPLADRGIPLDRAVVLTAAPFPVAGYSWFTDDFMFPRYVPVPHLHEGTDIFADFGTPILASGPGTVAAFANTVVGGLSVWVAGDDGTSLYYSHLLGFAEGMVPGMRVDTGTVIGYVGNTGNAITTPPHVHFEIHPPVTDKKGKVIASGVAIDAGGIGQTLTPAVNPKPYLDQWLVQAERQAQAFVFEIVQKLAALARQIHFARRVDDLFTFDGISAPGSTLWLSVLDPVLAAAGIARETVALDSLALSGPTAAARSAEEQRLAAVRLAVDAPDLKLGALTGRFNAPTRLVVLSNQQ